MGADSESCRRRPVTGAYEHLGRPAQYSSFTLVNVREEIGSMAFRKLRWMAPALMLAIGLLAACGGAGAAIPPTAAPTSFAPTTTAAAPAEAASPPAQADWLQTASLEGDYFVLGNPDAPVRVLDYSDFL